MHSSRIPAAILLLALIFIAASRASAELKPHVLFSDNAVLQRDKPIPVFGTCKKGERVEVDYRGSHYVAKTDGTQWSVTLNPSSASATPVEFIINGENRIELKNVLVGDVWFCSGQSNMEWQLSQSTGGQAAIAASDDNGLRLFSVCHGMADTPQTELKNDCRTEPGRQFWEVSGPRSTPDFSGVGYFFGRALRDRYNVPIGLIHASWGGTQAEAWTSRKALEANATFKPIVEKYDLTVSGYPDYLRKRIKLLTDHLNEFQDAKAKGLPLPLLENADEMNKPLYSPALNPEHPEEKDTVASLYNAMVAPLQKFPIKGVIWYQGESNTNPDPRPAQYKDLLTLLITDWRDGWNQKDLPFLIAQLAPYLGEKGDKEPDPEFSGSAWVREAQRKVSLTVPKTGMAVITDVGEMYDIHPPRKKEVGDRLALAARKVAYGESVDGSGPIYRSMVVKGDKAIVTFTNANGGLQAKGGDLTGFLIKGDGQDDKFVPAKAVINGDTVEVTGENVKTPVAVRFGWADYPIVNLWGGGANSLPVSPFATDK